MKVYWLLIATVVGVFMVFVEYKYMAFAAY